MSEFVVNSATGLIGSSHITSGDTKKDRVFFEPFLDPGVHITAAVTSITSTVSTVAAPILTDNKKSLYYLVTANTLEETFTVGLQVTLSDGQILNYTIVYDVDPPFTDTHVPNPVPLVIGPTGPAGTGGLKNLLFEWFYGH